MGKILKPFIFALIIVIILVSLHYIGWLKPVENIFVRGISPIAQKMRGASNWSKEYYGNWVKRKGVFLENERLKVELQNYQMNLARISSMEEENKLLKQELGFVKELDHKYVSAKIITGISDPASQSVVINRGSKDGIIKGLAVVAGKGIMIGKIIEVQDNFSKVLLLIDNNSKVAATIQNLDKTAGIVEGQYGLSFSMTNIPQDQIVAEGDYIVTSGLEGSIPKDILIAKVEKINSIEKEIFKTAILSPIVPFTNLSYVLVIIP